jgi:hypothetical protein
MRGRPHFATQAERFSRYQSAGVSEASALPASHAIRRFLQIARVGTLRTFASLGRARGVRGSLRPFRKADRSNSPPPQSLFLFNAVDGKNAESRVFAAHLLLNVAAAAIPPLLQAVHVLRTVTIRRDWLARVLARVPPDTACRSLVVT